MPPLILIDFAPIISHVKVDSSPELMESGLALKVVIIGAFDEVILSVADAVELPASLVAVSVYAVVEAGDTLSVPVKDTGPIPGLIETDVAPVTLHDNVADWPVMILPLSTPKLAMAGRAPVTAIVTDLRAEPNVLLATSVYVVVVPGDTSLVPLKETVPISGLIDTEVTPVASHCKVACCPDVIVAELALKDATTGAANHFEITLCRAMPAPISAATIIRVTDIFAMIPRLLLISCNSPGPPSPFCG